MSSPGDLLSGQGYARVFFSAFRGDAIVLIVARAREPEWYVDSDRTAPLMRETLLWECER